MGLLRGPPLGFTICSGSDQRLAGALGTVGASIEPSRLVLIPDEAAFVYVLFEHQSTFDERMPLRLLRYQTRIWERFAAEHPDATRIPPIVPLLLHQGPRPWPWEPKFSSVLDAGLRARNAMRSTLLEFEFILDDLARQTDAQIMGRASDAIVRLTLLALRNGRSHSRLFELMADAMRAMRNELRGPAVAPAIGRLARYALELGDESYSVICATFESALVPVRRSESMVSAADQLRAEGRREVLLLQLQARFGSIPSEVRSRVEQASIEQVISYLRRFAVSDTIDEIFKD